MERKTYISSIEEKLTGYGYSVRQVDRLNPRRNGIIGLIMFLTHSSFNFLLGNFMNCFHKRGK